MLIYEPKGKAREYGKRFYIKKDLAEQCKRFQFSQRETDMDYLTLKPWE